MNILAKMKCHEVSKTEWGETVKLEPVHADCPENKTFAEATPSGKLELTITNKAAHGAFEAGKSYLVTIAEAVAMLMLLAFLALFEPAARAGDLTYTTLPQTGDSDLVRANKAQTAPSSNTFLEITTATTTAVKSGSGIIEKLIVGTVGSSSKVVIYDNTAGSGTVIAEINTDTLGTYHFGCRFATGLTLVTTGTPKITVIYR